MTPADRPQSPDFVGTQAPGASPAQDLAARLRTTGTELGAALSALLDALPGAPHRPSELATELGVNRAIASKVLAATRQADPLELLHRVPGPDPLRKIVSGAQTRDVPPPLLEAARAAIREFDLLIRDEAGTRPALDALISASLPGARERFELASKYSVYKGLSQLKGVQAELWFGAAVVVPSPEDALKYDLTWLNGAAGMQRLRPGVTARFSYRHRSDTELEQEPLDSAALPALGVLSLDQFCTNPAARLIATRAGGAIHYTLPEDLLGPRQVVDMFVVDHHPASMNRYSDELPARRSALFLEPAVPVAKLVFDVLLHEQVFVGSDPELYQYDTGYDGIANVNDRARDIDRMDVLDSVEFLGHGPARFRAAELPRYPEILGHLAARFGWDLERFRGYRTRIQYPVYGWQISLAFSLGRQRR